MASESSRWIPEEVFTALGFAIPALARLIDKKCHITLAGWLVLVEIQRRGKRLPDGQSVLLRQTLTKLFDERGFTRPNVTKVLNTLFEQGLIDRPRLTEKERQSMFGSNGSRLAVVLTPAGQRKIEHFKDILQNEFDRWYANQSEFVKHALVVLRPAAETFAKALQRSQATT